MYKIEFKTDDKTVQNLCQKYWQIDDSKKFSYKIEELAEEYQIKKNDIPALVRQNSWVTSTTIFCQQCEIPFSFKTRSELTGRKPSSTNWICSACIEKKYQEKAIQRQKEIEQQNLEKQNYLEMQYMNGIENAFNIDNLSIKEMIYLLALLRCSASENLEFIERNQNNLSPSSSYSSEIISCLYNKNIILLKPNSNLDHIEITNQRISYYPLQAEWILSNHNLITMQDTMTYIENKLNSSDIKHTHKNELINLSLEISLQECLAYLNHQIIFYKLNFQAGEKTIDILTKSLNLFSVSQMYYFINKAIKDAAAYYQSGNVSKLQAANTIPSKVQNLVTKAINEKWEIKGYSRITDIPKSTLSHVLYEYMLNTSDGGFDYKFDELI